MLNLFMATFTRRKEKDELTDVCEEMIEDFNGSPDRRNKVDHHKSRKAETYSVLDAI